MRSKHITRLSLGLMAAVSLLACQPSQGVPEITPTTGVFSADAEAFYLKRYDVLLEAFKSGKLTTDYDTETILGEGLVAKPLPRGASALETDVLSELKNYVEAQGGAQSFMMYEDGKIVSEQYFGDASADSLVVAKSLAKPLGVIATGRAIEAGYIDSLDQSVSDFIVEWKETDKAAIKIRHLLDMRTGLLPQGRATGPQDVLNRAYLHPHHDEVIIHEYPLIDVPGTRYGYSNANSELVAVVLSRATGQSYQDWLASEVLAPLGASGGKIWLNREAGMAHSGCCAKLPSETFLKLAIVVLNDGQWEGKTFLPASFIKEVTTPTAQNPYAGMGIYLGKQYKEYRGAANPDGKDFTAAFHSEPYLDEDIALFDGNGNQVVYILPSRNIVIARLGGRPTAKEPWDNAYLPNTVITALEKTRR